MLWANGDVLEVRDREWNVTIVRIIRGQSGKSDRQPRQPRAASPASPVPTSPGRCSRDLLAPPLRNGTVTAADDRWQRLWPSHDVSHHVSTSGTSDLRVWGARRPSCGFGSVVRSFC
ncbi:uncharacterized protein LOC123515819 [Portunus trituberculatus]|uniref:uncharacterized protein LOC123515819 n=1 Tax=Portunus trituberculatus TaxID=210409 RepID=UPI001E1CFA82|nr:uncharacterized protein LOC123515819 [Portunus trituberculatus]